MSPNQRKLVFVRPLWRCCGLSGGGAVCLVFILSRDGVAYFEEGWRFTRGHSRFGVTPYLMRPQNVGLVAPDCRAAGAVHPGGSRGALGRAFRQSESRWRLSVAVLGLYFLWMLCSQNPANLEAFCPGILPGGGVVVGFLTQKVRSNWLVALAATGFLPDYSAYWRLPPGDAPVHVAPPRCQVSWPSTR